MKSYLEFERDIKDLEEELEKLKDPYNKEGLSEVNTNKISEMQAQIDEKLAMLIGSLAAAHSVETIGNKQPINKIKILKSMEHLLK